MIKKSYKVHIQKHSRHLLINTKITQRIGFEKQTLLECDLSTQ